MPLCHGHRGLRACDSGVLPGPSPRICADLDVAQREVVASSIWLTTGEQGAEPWTGLPACSTLRADSGMGSDELRLCMRPSERRRSTGRLEPDRHQIRTTGTSRIKKTPA